MNVDLHAPPFPPPLCDFCQHIAEQQIRLLTGDFRAVYYPQRSRASLETPLSTLQDSCALCAYVLSILTLKDNRDLRHARTKSAVCYYEDQWAALPILSTLEIAYDEAVARVGLSWIYTAVSHIRVLVRVWS
jgi:hypothetical protein